MASVTTRRRASTLKAPASEVCELRDLLGGLRKITAGSDEDELLGKLGVGQRIRQSLHDDNSVRHSKDAFRHLDGFQIVLEAMKDLLASAHDGDDIFPDLLQTFFGIISAALRDHRGNQRYFEQRVGEGGWSKLKESLRAFLANQRSRKPSYLTNIVERIFGCLLACALSDESLILLYSNIGRRINLTSELTIGSLGKKKVEQATQSIAKILETELDPNSTIHHPEAVLALVELRKDIRMTDNDALVSPAVAFATLSILHRLTTISTSNLVAMHCVGTLGSILPCLVDPDPSNSLDGPQLRAVSADLLRLGVGSLDDAHLLYRSAKSSSLTAELLLNALKTSREPAYAHFDLSLHGYASIELPGIGRDFPPLGSSPGYTLSIWLQIVHFDSSAHTTIFGAFDATQTCFVLVYLEKDTHNLILQTSVTSSRPSVRFKQMAFVEGRWYHLVIAHQRPKTTSSSRASLFINGEFVEQVKSQYPTPPPRTSKKSDTDNSASSRKQSSNAIQTFIGTPQDLATRLGKGLVSTQWRLASSYLFASVLSDDLITVYYQLGPRYTGNFQDCLGSFQTYEASAALNLRNESLHPGTEENSEIVAAIRSKAGLLLPESTILLNLSASVVLDDNDQKSIDETQLIKSLSKSASKNLKTVTRAGCNALAINGATPSINEALLHASGFAVLTGSPTIVVPQPLDEASWRIGGCASVGLALLESSQEEEDIERTLSIIFESIRDNWRNSEAMEREHGFGVLATILTAKLDQPVQSNAESPADALSEQKRNSLHLRILKMILNFVGFKSDRMENSVINNPLAYRILLVDMGFWRTCSSEVQKLYYEQFLIFASRSKYRHFNSRRLLRMRLLKKWLENLKTEIFTEDIFEYFLQAFRVIIGPNVSAESMRSLSLYITYAIHKPSARDLHPSRSKSLKLKTSTPIRRKTLPSPSPNSPLNPGAQPAELTQLQVAFKMLKIYVDMLCQEGDSTNVQKFARTVTNKWLLHLIADDESAVVVMAAKILARLLVTSGPSYMSKFIEKTGGIVIMQHRFKRWWDIPSMWVICFGIFFGVDLAKIDFERPFDLFNLLELFSTGDNVNVAYPEMLPVITTMLQNGLRNVTRDQLDPDSPMTSPKAKDVSTFSPNGQRSATLSMNAVEAVSSKSAEDKLASSALLLRTVTRFLADLHSRSQNFREFTSVSNYVQEMFAVLFPIVVSSDAVSPETELHARDSALTFHGNDVIMRPLAATSMANAPVVRTSTLDESGHSKPRRHQTPRRMSSYVLVTSEISKTELSASKLQAIVSPKNSKANFNLSSAIVQELLEVTIAVFEDQIFSRKDFPGLGLFMRVPPGFQEHQAYFETFILRNTLSQLGNHIKLNQKLLWEPRVLTNVSRFAAHLSEGIYEGWFIDGAEDSLDFLAQILEYLQIPDIAVIKSVRLCSNIIASIRSILLRIVLLRLSELDEVSSSDMTVSFLNKLAYWQTVLQPTDDGHVEQFRLFCYLLYSRLTCASEQISMAAANLWRMLIVQKPDEISNLLMQGGTTDGASLVRSFKKIMEIDNEAFLSWVNEHKLELDVLLFRTISRSWDQFVEKENHKTVETANARIGKRREKLRMWELENSKRDEILRRHESSADHWRSNIYAAEDLKRQRAVQDQQDGQAFNASTWEKMKQALTRPCGAFEERIDFKWQLDQTEGRNRMRLRLIPDRKAHLNDFQPKRRQSQGPSKVRRSNTLRSKASVKSLSQLSTPKKKIPSSPNSPSPFTPDSTVIRTASPVEGVADGEEVSGDEDFEIIESPGEEPEGYEDKNRKVMRSLQRGDQVEQVHNVARIVGLEAIESLLILGKSYLYLLDSLFQRSDGEIVNAWQAPHDERDAYLQMISGREADSRQSSSSLKSDHETRSWRWEDVLSISKRRFLFRDVAIELFFVDGRSYLLTAKTVALRDELFQRLLTMATNVMGRSATASEDSWRIDAVRNPADETQTFGSKFTSVFASATSNPATKRWIRGEISNYHYLMLINTMAGRTFNDLTQYPVFPWVIADYTSEELDLTDPRSYRDLSKPMGCQTAERQAEFRDRYQSFAEMGDQNAPPFHYGTHYSSAMIVTSYLIRLQPFVQSYLLLQGGSFDHPDRLFYSMEKAWSSASRDNMTDVRELIPEFFYLPEFFSNVNGYDFGTRQGNGGAIDTVILPPWAKGDPKIFIAKNREALESEYVSQHLHQWIDLIFGHKQRGENALEATNVFHHLSYHGSKDLDAIEDPVERLATIGIIHNFGQTPHQVFQKAHPPREEMKHKGKRLDSAAPSLTRLPFPVLEVHDRIASLQYSTKHNQLLSAGPFRIHIGPAFDKYMEWGFIDNSVRFFITDTKRPAGLFEHVHQSQLSSALFADSKTLITAGNDCTVSVWTVLSTHKAVDLQPRITFFGHRRSVNTLAVSRSFSALLSASSDGQVILWDLTRLELVRVLTSGKPVDCAKINDVDGTILLCRSNQVSIWTLNGDLLVEQDLFAEGEDNIYSCAFYEGSGNDYLERNLIFTGQRRGVVNVWNIAIKRRIFVLEHVKSMHHLDQAGFNVAASMTAVLPMAQVVYTGDDDGRVYEWDCIQRQ